MVRLYSYQNYRWNLISNTIDDTYQVITDFYYGTGMYKQYGEIKEIIKEWDETWKNTTPPDTKSIYLLQTETRTFIFIESLLSVGAMAIYYWEHKL